MWNTVNDTLAALRSAEARLTGTDKISANVPNPFTEPAVDYADYELSRLAALRTRAEDWCVRAIIHVLFESNLRSETRSIPGSVHDVFQTLQVELDTARSSRCGDNISFSKIQVA